MFFVETLEGEDVADWRRAVEDMIDGVLPVPPNWQYPYTHDRVITFSGRRYRSFDTAFGAVIIALLLAGRRRSLTRAMLFIAEGEPGRSPTAVIVADGTETEADPKEALEQLAAND